MTSLVHFISHTPLLIMNEIYLMGLMYGHYKWSYCINAITTAADFIWWMLLIDGGTLVPEKVAPAVIGYLVWVYANYTMYDANSFIIDAGQTGVLEQVYLTPFPLAVKLMSRFIACAVFCTLELTLVAVALLLLCPVYIPISIDGFLAFLITIVGIAGFALLLAGIGLVFKKSQPFAYLLNTTLLFFNGAILPLDNMPHWIRVASKTFPTTQGIEVLRSITFKGATLSSCLVDGSLIILLVNSAAYLLGGTLLFLMCERWAQKHGSLGHY